jgi:oligoribonuclease (3'-5' exoribonuclease)
VKGALKTMRKHLPILAVSIYHNIEELIDFPLFLLKEFPQYDFELHLRTYDASVMYEMAIWGLPR